jgi:hypothetical protein
LGTYFWRGTGAFGSTHLSKFTIKTPPPPPPGPGQPGYVANSTDAATAVNNASFMGKYFAGQQLQIALCNDAATFSGWECEIYGPYSRITQNSPLVAFVNVTYSNGSYHIGQVY